MTVYLSVLVSKLESLHQPQSLVHIATHGKIVDGDLSQLPGGVDDEEAAEGDALVLLEHPVGAADGHVLVGQERDLHGAEAALLAAPLAPRQVGEVAVRGARDHRAVDRLELRGTVIEGDDLRGTDEGEVQGVEEDDHVLALVVVQANVLKLAFHHCGSFELGGLHARLKSHVRVCADSSGWGSEIKYRNTGY